jgi:acyl carrier protein
MSSSLALVYEAIDQVNAQITKGDKIAKDPATPLLDSNGGIDSLAMVNLVVGIEQIIFDKTGKSVTVVDEEVFSSPESPFRTVGTLAAYIDKLTA